MEPLLLGAELPLLGAELLVPGLLLGTVFFVTGEAVSVVCVAPPPPFFFALAGDLGAKSKQMQAYK